MTKLAWDLWLSVLHFKGSANDSRNNYVSPFPEKEIHSSSNDDSRVAKKHK